MDTRTGQSIPFQSTTSVINKINDVCQNLPQQQCTTPLSLHCTSVIPVVHHHHHHQQHCYSTIFIIIVITAMQANVYNTSQGNVGQGRGYIFMTVYDDAWQMQLNCGQTSKPGGARSAGAQVSRTGAAGAAEWGSMSHSDSLHFVHQLVTPIRVTLATDRLLQLLHMFGAPAQRRSMIAL